MLGGVRGRLREEPPTRFCVAKVKLTNIVGQAKQDEDISKTGLVLVNDLVLLMIRNV